MKISKEKTLQDLQLEFNKYYPYLTIEFYKNPHEYGKSSEEEERLNPKLKVGDLRKSDTNGYIPMHSYQKVGRFEQLFAKTFGLYVQVFRKSYGKWLQTWATDMWTLEEQNNRGRIMGDK